MYTWALVASVTINLTIFLAAALVTSDREGQILHHAKHLNTVNSHQGHRLL